MKKAIAMKCTQEQFDAVKDKLVGLKIEVSSFKRCNYLFNQYTSENLIINVELTDLIGFDSEIHETWNEEIFLNACGIETERIFKGSDLQYRKNGGCWMDLNSFGYYEYRIKSDNTLKKQELESQIAELQNQLKNL